MTRRSKAWWARLTETERRFVFNFEIERGYERNLMQTSLRDSTSYDWPEKCVICHTELGPRAGVIICDRCASRYKALRDKAEGKAEVFDATLS